MRETAALALLCLFIALAALGVVFWVIIDAARDGVLVTTVLSLDGLLMISVALLIATMFGFCFLWLAYEARLWELLKSRRSALADSRQPASSEKAPADP